MRAPPRRPAPVPPDTGSLRGDLLELPIDLVYGPVYLRLLQGHAPLTDAFVASVVDLALAGLEGGQRPGGGPEAQAPRNVVDP